MRFNWLQGRRRLQVLVADVAVLGEQLALVAAEGRRTQDELEQIRCDLREAVDEIIRSNGDTRLRATGSLSDLATVLRDEAAATAARLARLEKKHALHVEETDKVAVALTERIELARLATRSHP